MKKVFTVFFLLAAFAAGDSAVLANQQDQKDKLREKLQRLRVRQTLTAADVVRRAQQLRQNNKGVARAMKDAEKRGLRPAFDRGVVVLAADPATDVARLSMPFAQPMSFMQPVSFWSSSSQGGGDYEITFIPYDDGDPNTWEGIIYRTGPDLPEDTQYAEVNIEAEEPDVTQAIYYPEGGGGSRANPRIVKKVPTTI